MNYCKDDTRIMLKDINAEIEYQTVSTRKYNTGYEITLETQGEAGERRLIRVKSKRELNVALDCILIGINIRQLG